MAFNHKHLIDITEYSADDIMAILETAVKFKEVNERRIKQVPTLKGFTVVNMFNEPSTRTRSSFEMAEKRLSAASLNFGGSSTSSVKGESLVDTVETLCSYKIDMIVVRDKHAGVPRKIADVSGVHVIDAGDGLGPHRGLADLAGRLVALIPPLTSKTHPKRQRGATAGRPPTFCKAVAPDQSFLAASVTACVQAPSGALEMTGASPPAASSVLTVRS